MYAPIQIASVTDEVGYSSSLVDTSTFLYQVVEFWNNLGWSCPEETYTFMMELINVSTTMALEVYNMYLTFIWTGSLYGVVVWQMWVVPFALDASCMVILLTSMEFCGGVHWCP